MSRRESIEAAEAPTRDRRSKKSNAGKQDWHSEQTTKNKHFVDNHLEELMCLEASAPAYFTKTRCIGYDRLDKILSQRRLAKLPQRRLRASEFNKYAEEMAREHESRQPVNVWVLCINAGLVQVMKPEQCARDGYKCGFIAANAETLCMIGQAVPVNDDVLYTGYLCKYVDVRAANAACDILDENNDVGLEEVIPLNDAQATIYNFLLQVVRKLLATEHLASTIFAHDLTTQAEVMDELQQLREFMINAEAYPDVSKRLFEMVQVRCTKLIREKLAAAKPDVTKPAGKSGEEEPDSEQSSTAAELSPSIVEPSAAGPSDAKSSTSELTVAEPFDPGPEKAEPAADVSAAAESTAA